MSYEFNNNTPIYIQIIDSIKSDIVRGKYLAGDRLPSVRELSLIYGVNPNTVQKALSELESIGLIVTDRTNGKYVTKDTAKVQQVKKENLQQLVSEFLDNIASMGVSKEEVIDIIKGD